MGFRFDYECRMFDHEYDFLAFELAMLTSGTSVILVVNTRTAARFDPTTILQTSSCLEFGRAKKSYS